MRVSHYEPTQMLRLAFVLNHPHPTEEGQFLEDLQDKTSPNFHKYLSAEEWNTRFGPSVDDEQAVVDWATSNGLKVTYRYKNRLLVDVEAPAGVIEKALGITFNNYQLNGQIRYANDRDPVFSAPLDTIVQSVQGLNSFESVLPARAMHTPIHPPDYQPGPAVDEPREGGADADPEAVRKFQAAFKSAFKGESESGPEYTPWNSSYGFTPAGIFSPQTYNYGALMAQGHCCNPTGNSGGTPPQTSIAIAGFATLNYSDMTGFQSNFPYLAWHSYSYNIDGAYTCGTNDDGCGEITLDTEWSTATAHSMGAEDNTATVYVYQGANYNNSTVIDVYNHILDDGHAKIMTTSWDCAENQSYSTDGDCYNSTMVARDGVFQSMVAQGMTLINASGDEGATATWCEDSLGVMFPASDPNVVAAGGTFLEPYTNGDYYQEVAWTGGTGAGSCSKNNGGGTGGFSQYWGAPSFQTSWVDSSWTKRATPDFSLNAAEAQGYYFNGSMSGVGGTSIVSPELAGFFAQENAYLLTLGNQCGGGTTNCAPIGNPNWVLYEEGHRNNAAHYPFYDITVGCNSNDITAEYGLTAWCAGPGFDEVSGWGSANMLQLAWALNWNITAFYSNGIPYDTFSGPATGKWYNTDQVVGWTIVDYTGTEGSTHGTGIAGFTQGWDSIPSDPSGEATPGDGNSFYDGPQFKNATNGCLAFNGADGCGGAPGEGCHTAHVRGWNNQGWTTGDTTYGPICYDITPPTIGISTNHNTSETIWVNLPVTVTLTANDPKGSNGSAGSGINKTYYKIDAFCSSASLGSCSVYSGPFTISAQGQHYVWYFTEDNAGNFSNETYQYISIDTTPPVTTAGLSGTVYNGSVYDTAVGVTLSATDNLSGVAKTYYSVDGGATATYSGSAFTVSALGSHTVKYWSVDGAGNTETPTTVSFSIHSPTTAKLTATPSPSVFGQSVKMTATITATLSGTPTGTVQFWNGATNLGTATFSGGIATLSTTALPVGALTLQASYLGAGNFIPTNSVPFDQTVNPVTAVLTSPALSSALTSNSVKFTWAAGTAGSQYDLHLSAVAAGGYDLFASGHIPGLSTTANGLPTNGGKIYARLYTILNGLTVYNDYTFTALSLAQLTSPAPSSTLTSNSIEFAWSAGTAGSQYDLHLSTVSPGGYDLYLSGHIAATSVTVGGLPTNGKKIYARLYTIIDGVTYYNDYTYTAASLAKLTSPAPSSTLTATSVKFTWSASTPVSPYDLHLSAVAPGGYDLYLSGHITATSVTVNNLPDNGKPIYARLYTILNGVTLYHDYVYTAK